MTVANHCPSTLREGYAIYSPKAVKDLFDGKRASPWLDFDMEGAKAATGLEESMQGISVSGVQEKFPAIIENGRIRITRKGERSTHILKPAPWNDLRNRKQLPANEHLTMQIASQVHGIRTVANGLCFTRGKQAVYITKRIDLLADGTKLPMEDFAAITGRNEQHGGCGSKYDGDYEEIASAIRENVAAWKVDMERFLEVVLFSHMHGNGDLHMKNLSLIHVRGEYRLAPAYDLLNTRLHVDDEDFALSGGLSHDEASAKVPGKNHFCI